MMYVHATGSRRRGGLATQSDFRDREVDTGDAFVWEEKCTSPRVESWQGDCAKKKKGSLVVSPRFPQPAFCVGYTEYTQRRPTPESRFGAAVREQKKRGLKVALSLTRTKSQISPFSLFCKGGNRKEASNRKAG